MSMGGPVVREVQKSRKVLKSCKLSGEGDFVKVPCREKSGKMREGETKTLHWNGQFRKKPITVGSGEMSLWIGTLQRKRPRMRGNRNQATEGGGRRD